MKPRKTVVFAVFLGLLLFAFAIGLAQDPSKSSHKKHAECCCVADSCPMRDSAASDEAKECCCCQADSCDMKHDGAMKHDATKGGESCDMKSAQQHKQHSGDAACCKAKHQAKNSREG